MRLEQFVLSKSAVVSLAEHLQVWIDPHRPEALISTECMGQIHDLAARLPAGISQFFGLECRLANVRAQADFAFCSTAEHGGREVIAGLTRGDDISKSFLNNPVR